MSAAEALVHYPLVAIGRALVDFLWQGTVVAILCCAVLYLLRHKSANARYASACTAMIVMALCPLVTFGLLAKRAPAVPEQTTEISRPAATMPNAGVSNWRAVRSPLRRRSSTSTTIDPEGRPWLTWTVVVWLAGVLLLSIRTMGALLVSGRWGRLPAYAPKEALQISLTELAVRMGLRRHVFVESLSST
jgi:hypothetical protein